MGIEILDQDINAFGLRPIQIWGKVPLVFTGSGAQGFTNVNLHFVNHDNTYLIRMPQNLKRRERTIQDTRKEMEFTGFETHGGVWKMRTQKEQVDFSQNAFWSGLRVVPLSTMEGHRGLIMPYIKDASTLRESLLHGSLDSSLRVLTHLRHAHKLDIIFGDRWTNNTLLTPDGGFYEVDYDIALGGKHAREFELAQFLFHVVHFSAERGDILRKLKDYSCKHPLREDYEIDVVELFVKNYTHHYGNIGTYEELSVIGQDEITPLLSALRE